jgi:hypothetical protein
MSELNHLHEYVQEIASGSCCETEGGSIDDPCCEVMQARSILHYFREDTGYEGECESVGEGRAA